MEERTKSRRGFASMSPEKRREISRKGGKSVRPALRAFSKDKELAATAGRKGGSSVRSAMRAFSQDRDLAVTAGRKGGAARKGSSKGGD